MSYNQYGAHRWGVICNSWCKMTIEKPWVLELLVPCSITFDIFYLKIMVTWVVIFGFFCNSFSRNLSLGFDLEILGLFLYNKEWGVKFNDDNLGWKDVVILELFFFLSIFIVILNMINLFWLFAKLETKKQNKSFCLKI